MLDKRKLVAILILLSLILGSSVAVSVAQTTSSQRTVYQNLAGINGYSAMATAIKTAGLDGALSGATQYTVFAPSNGVFNAVPKESLTALANDRVKFNDLLRNHIVPGKLTYADLTKMSQVTTLGGHTLPVSYKGGVLTVGGVRVVNQGIDSSNGAIYQVDSIMMPPGFVMPKVSRSTGLNLGWLGWVIGAIVLGAIALYLFSRKKHAAPRADYERQRTRYEDATKVEPTRTPEETMRQVRESVSSIKEPTIADIAKNVELPLGGDALTGLNMLINKGKIGDKQDLLGLLAKSYMQNNLGAAMSGGKEPGISTILDIITKTGLGSGFAEGDVKKFLVPLLITGFMAIYNYLNKKPAMKVT